jgi:hypothetical protein
MIFKHCFSHGFSISKQCCLKKKAFCKMCEICFLKTSLRKYVSGNLSMKIHKDNKT